MENTPSNSESVPQESVASPDPGSILPSVPIHEIDINTPQYFFRMQQDFLDKLKLDFNSNFVRVHNEIAALSAQVQEHHTILNQNSSVTEPQPGASNTNKKRKIEQADEFIYEDTPYGSEFDDSESHTAEPSTELNSSFLDNVFSVPSVAEPGPQASEEDDPFLSRIDYLHLILLDL